MASLLLRLPQLLNENQSRYATSSERTGLEFRLLLQEEAGVVLIRQVSVQSESETNTTSFQGEFEGGGRVAASLF